MEKATIILLRDTSTEIYNMEYSQKPKIKVIETTTLPSVISERYDDILSKTKELIDGFTWDLYNSHIFHVCLSTSLAPIKTLVVPASIIGDLRTIEDYAALDNFFHNKLGPEILDMQNKTTCLIEKEQNIKDNTCFITLSYTDTKIIEGIKQIFSAKNLDLFRLDSEFVALKPLLDLMFADQQLLFTETPYHYLKSYYGCICLKSDDDLNTVIQILKTIGQNTFGMDFFNVPAISPSDINYDICSWLHTESKQHSLGYAVGSCLRLLKHIPKLKEQEATNGFNKIRNIFKR